MRAKYSFEQVVRMASPRKAASGAWHKPVLSGRRVKQLLATQPELAQSADFDKAVLVSSVAAVCRAIVVDCFAWLRAALHALRRARVSDCCAFAALVRSLLTRWWADADVAVETSTGQVGCKDGQLSRAQGPQARAQPHQATRAHRSASARGAQGCCGASYTTGTRKSASLQRL